MNKLTVSILIICSALDQFSNLWKIYLCEEDGIIEQVLTLFFGLMVVALQMPVFIDLSYILL
jgi:hypothetical protein